MRKKMSNCRSNVVCRSADGSISFGNACRTKQNVLSNTRVASRRKKSTQAKLDINYEVSEGKVSLTLPLRTKSEANCFEHWRVKHERHKQQQFFVAYAMKDVKDLIQLPCKILFTRMAKNMLDKHDNLPMSFKYIVDCVCSILTGNKQAGKADSDERISISYDQIASKDYGIKIDFSFSP